MLQPLLEQSITSAINLAIENKQNTISLEHLLLALLRNQEIKQIWIQNGVKVESMSETLCERIATIVPVPSQTSSKKMSYSMSLQRVFKKAQSQHNGEVLTWLDILNAMLDETENQVSDLFKKSNLNLQKIEDSLQDSENTSVPVKKITVSSKESLLEKIIDATDLPEPLIGRNNEITQIIKVLCQFKKNNPLLVGEVGVGKQAIVKELARRIANAEVPNKIANATIFSIDIGSLFINLKFRGEMESRFNTIADELKNKKNAILFINDIYDFFSFGENSELSIGRDHFLKHLLNSKNIHCIGSTSYERFRALLLKKPQHLQYFNKIDIQEPGDEETLSILQGAKLKYEAYHNVQYSEEALKRTIELSSRYILDAHLPGKAIDILDEAGAYQELKGNHGDLSLISEREIEEVIAKKVNIPLASLTTTDRELLKSLPDKLKNLVYGQEEAIDSLCHAIQLSKFGLRDPQKPIGSFLLTGPTGVGKTEISKQIAKLLNIEFIRFDMSEYMEKHTVSKLIGAPPGYVGFERGGLLTEAINKNPHCILLLDEIEKANTEIFNLLLQVMDYSSLTDSNGRKSDFHHVMLIMTTNAGAEQLERGSIGFSNTIESTDDNREITRLFSPEFRNRLDGIIHFKYLDKDTIMLIANKQLTELKSVLKEKNIILNMTEAAENWIAEKGYNRVMGARPLEHLIKEKIKIPLSVEILYGNFENQHGTVNIDVKDDDLVIKFDLK